MNFMQKMGKIYDFAINGKILKSPKGLLKKDKMSLVFGYLTTHDLDHMPVEEILT